MLVNTAILLGVLASLSAFNAHRSQVVVTRDESRTIKGSVSSPTHLFDLASELPNCMNLSDYLLSLSFDRPLNLRGLIVAFIHSRLSRKPFLRWVALVIIGAVPFLGSIVIAREPIDLLVLFERFLSIYSVGIFSSIADFLHFVKPFSMKRGVDAVTKLITPRLCASSTGPYDPLEEFPRVLNGLSDELEMKTPEPFLPNLFPQLCLGWGGLKPLQSPKTDKRNELMAEIFNRLDANVLVEANAVEGSKLFSFKWENQQIHSVDELAKKIPGISVFFTKNSSSFGVMLCVKDGEGSYRQLPFAWLGRTAIRDPDNGRQMVALSYHSSFVVTGDETCPLGQFRVQFFLGPEGVTAWKAGTEYIKPWGPIVETSVLNNDQSIEALRVATCLSCAVNLASKTQNLAVGGYALYGTCLDTSSVIKYAVLGIVDDFPLVASGDARAAAIAACKRLASKVKQNGWEPEYFEKVKNAMLALPDDTVVVPSDLLSTIDRFQKNILGDFAQADQLKQDLVTLKQKWKTILDKN